MTIGKSADELSGTVGQSADALSPRACAEIAEEAQDVYASQLARSCFDNCAWLSSCVIFQRVRVCAGALVCVCVCVCVRVCVGTRTAHQ